MTDPVVAAVECARSWATTSPNERASTLESAADALEAQRTELVALADSETHLGEVRLNGELTRTTFQLRLFADEARAGNYLDVRIDRPDEQWPTGARPDLRRYRGPVGPVLVFAASNFPFAFSVAGGDTAAALAAGCPVVVKAHPGHPRLSRRVAGILSDVLGTGVLGLVEGEQAGVDALRAPGIRAAAFTGSVRGGLALARIAAERSEPIPFYGEMGSVNPVLVTPGAAEARLEEIAKGYVGSLTQGAGQFCTNPGILFVPEGTELVEHIAERLRNVSAAPMLNDRIAEGYREGASRVSALTGVREVVWPTDESSVAARLLEMHLDDFRLNPAAAEECFGPLGLVVTYRRIDELPAVISALPGQLTATLQAEDDEDIGEVAEALVARSGRILWNGWPTGVAVTSAMQHGGPFPATTAPSTTSVGTAAIERFLRPVTYQGWPQHHLPEPLRDSNPWEVPQQIG